MIIYFLVGAIFMLGSAMLVILITIGGLVKRIEKAENSEVEIINKLKIYETALLQNQNIVNQLITNGQSLANSMNQLIGQMAAIRGDKETWQ